MTTNHPAHGPVSLDRLHQIREILSKAAAQIDGGNLGYAMADAVKVINGAIAAFGTEPVAYMTYKGYLLHAADPKLAEYSEPMPLYAAPQLPQPAVLSVSEGVLKSLLPDVEKSEFWFEHNGKIFFEGVRFNNAVFEACRATLLQAGNHTEQHLDMVNSPVIPDDVRRMGWLVSKTVDVREPMVYGSHSLFWSQTITDEEDDYHATKLREQIDAAMAVEQAAAPQQEVK